MYTPPATTVYILWWPLHAHISLHTTIHISTTTCSNETLQQHTAQATANYQRVHKFPNLIEGIANWGQTDPWTPQTPRTPRTRNGLGPEMDHSHIDAHQELSWRKSLPSLIVEFDALTVTSQGLAGIAFPNTDNAGIERHRTHLPRSLLGCESAQVRHGVLERVYKNQDMISWTMTPWPSVTRLGLNSCVPRASHCKNFFHCRVSSVTMVGPQYWLASSLSCTELAWESPCILQHFAT